MAIDSEKLDKFLPIIFESFQVKIADVCMVVKIARQIMLDARAVLPGASQFARKGTKEEC
jgi:hypothetical protein